VSIVCASRSKIENTGVSRLAFCFNLTAYGFYLYRACRNVFRKLVPCCMKSDLIPWYWYGRMIQIPSLGLASNPSQLTTDITRICHASATHYYQCTSAIGLLACNQNNNSVFSLAAQAHSLYPQHIRASHVCNLTYTHTVYIR
jgi:hypothetical protein